MGNFDQGKRAAILVTGANGFVGQHVLNQLTPYAERHSIRVVAGIKPGSRLDVAQQEVLELDIENHAAVSSWLDENKPKAIIHLAAISAPQIARDNPDSAWSINFSAVRKLAESMLLYTPQTKLIFAGSSEAYGNSFATANSAPISEDKRLEPQTVYGATKAAADLVLAQLSHQGLNCVRFRSFNHTGPGQAENFVSSSFAKQIAEIELGHREPVIKVGNLESIKDFLDVRDVAAAYVKAIDANRLDPSSNALNLCSQIGISIQQILDTLLELTDLDVKIESDPERVRAGEIPTTIGSNEKIKVAMAWQPKHGLKSTLLDLLDSWRHQLRHQKTLIE
ncbi:MAG: GDP-mannose 4,6-dehydratase [Pseudomonadota bacterium]